MKARPFAAFDIDGTIIRWQLYHAIGDALAKRGIIDPNSFAEVRAARMNWKRRTGEEGFKEYELKLIQAFDHALAGLEVSTLDEISTEVFEEYKDQVYRYTRDLIRDLKTKNYLLFAISGSPSVIVAKFAKYYEFDDFAATEYPAQNERFLGTKDLSLGRKPELLQNLIKKHKATIKGSIAVGDSEGDIDMLAVAEQPIAMNPSKLLFQHAQAHGWKVVLERKNMVYELEPTDGSYLLAQTNS